MSRVAQKKGKLESGNYCHIVSTWFLPVSIGIVLFVHEIMILFSIIKRERFSYENDTKYYVHYRPSFVE